MARHTKAVSDLVHRSGRPVGHAVYKLTLYDQDDKIVSNTKIHIAGFRYEVIVSSIADYLIVAQIWYLFQA